MREIPKPLLGAALGLVVAAVATPLGGCGNGGGSSSPAPFDASYDTISAGSNLNPATSATRGAVAGTVTDSAAGRVSRATVTISDATRAHAGSSRSATTDVNGVYSLGNVEPADYRLSVTGPTGMGYADATQTIRVVANQVTRPGNTENRTALAGGPPAPTGGSKWRGAKIYDDWRFYNSACGTESGVPAGQRCRACHGWQGEASIGTPAHRLVDRLPLLSKAQVAHTIEEHPAPVTVGSNTLDQPFRQKFVDVPDVRGIGAVSRAQKVADLAEFLKDPALFGTVVDYTSGGDMARGTTLFETMTGQIGCGLRCHGQNGEAIDFHKGGTDPTAEWLGDVANGGGGNELAFRIKFGHPRPEGQQLEVWGRSMPAFLNPEDHQQGHPGLPLIKDQDIKDLREHEKMMRQAKVLGIPPEAGTICP